MEGEEKAAGSHSRISSAGGLGLRKRMSISNEVLGDAVAPGESLF